MKFEAKSIAIGVAAGLAAALLSVGSVVHTTLSLILFFAAPLPVMVAGLGWGPAAALAALVAAFAAVAGFASLVAAMAVTLPIALPGAVMAHFASLAQSGNDGRLAWFPLSGVFFRGVLALAAGFVIAGVVTGYSADFAKEFANEMLKQFAASNPQIVIEDAVRTRFAAMLAALLPYAQPASWLLILVSNFYAALHIARLSGQLKRPRDYWPGALRLPKSALTVLAISLAVSFLGGGLGSAAAVPAGALLMAFSLVGLAVFHSFAAQKSWRVPGLWLAYVALALMGFLLIPFLIAGLLTTMRDRISANPS
jgi:Predicted membrane protein (DUF2232)